MVTHKRDLSLQVFYPGQRVFDIQSRVFRFITGDCWWSRKRVMVTWGFHGSQPILRCLLVDAPVGFTT